MIIIDVLRREGRRERGAAQLGDVLRGGFVAEVRGGRVAGSEFQQDEGQGGDAEDDGNHQQHTPEDVLSHARSLKM
jgi:hypothetical protein